MSEPPVSTLSSSRETVELAVNSGQSGHPLISLFIAGAVCAVSFGGGIPSLATLPQARAPQAYEFNHALSPLSYGAQKSRSSIDLLAVRNRQIIDGMATYRDNWNGYGAPSFSAGSLSVFRAVIERLAHQPSIMPTARQSLVLQYDFPDKTQLAIELFEDYAEMVYIPHGDFAKASTKLLRGDLEDRIAREVEALYASERYC